MRSTALLVVAAEAWPGLALQLVASVRLTGSTGSTGSIGSIGAAVWAMLYYFTVFTNIAAALLFTTLASGQRISPRLVGGVTLAILLVGAVYHVLLRGFLDLSGGAALADFLLHTVTPIVVLLWWIAFARKDSQDRRDSLVWAVFLLIYFCYGLARGTLEGRYLYPFMNVATLGWLEMLLHGAAIAIAFIVAGYMLFGINRLFSTHK